MDLIDAVINLDLPKIKQLLETGANPNHADDWAKVTPLHYAVLHNNMDIAALLVTGGANPNSRTSVDDQTPLELAKELGHLEMFNFLNHIVKS